MKRLVTIALLIATSCSGWSPEERTLIMDSPQVMRVLSVDNTEDAEVLRDTSTNLNRKQLQSEIYKTLIDKMIATVTDPSQDGVGIAAPQVGISRRIVAVQRLDKEGEPFEVYPNIKITEMRGEMQPGPEGCLSVPGLRGNVLRSRDIDIQYTTKSLKDTIETVTGFTAVIFQHECDHLDGVIYTDRAIRIFTSDSQ